MMQTYLANPFVGMRPKPSVVKEFKESVSAFNKETIKPKRRDRNGLT